MIRKTPGVYIEKVDNSQGIIPEVETALPVFIGYTERAEDAEGNKLVKRPTRIRDLSEFELRFGRGYEAEEYRIFADSRDNTILDIEITQRYYLYDCLRSFYENGGGDCIILSIGEYGNLIKKEDFIEGLEVIRREDGPTLLLFPDAVELYALTPEHADSEFGQLQQACLKQCADLKDRFTILDIREGFNPRIPGQDPISNFREQIGNENLNYGAVYYPWIYTSFEFPIRSRYLSLFSKDRDEGDFVPRHIRSLSTSPEHIKYIRSAENAREEVNALVRLFDPLTSFFEEGFSFNFKHLAAYGGLISQSISEIRSLSMAERDDVLAKKTWDKFLALVRAPIFALASIPILSELKSPAIQRAFARLKPKIRSFLASAILDLISIEKQEAILQLGSNPKTLEDINQIYAVLDKSDWVRGAIISDIEGSNDSLPGNKPLDKIAAATAIIYPISTRLAQALTELFDAVFEREKEADKVLFEHHPFFKEAKDRLLLRFRRIPPSGSIAGLYSIVDASRGVFKAPANVSIESVLGPVVEIDDKAQEDLNVHYTGKSVNAIRDFFDQGTTVWGARTLAGNDLEWRYIPVRRLFIFVETSLKKALETLVFEPNDIHLWTKIKFEIRRFLRGIWKQGGLSGATENEAFFVAVGLGETMVPIDILEGRMIIEIGLAASRPLEFINLKLICSIEEN